MGLLGIVIMKSNKKGSTIIIRRKLTLTIKTLSITTMVSPQEELTTTKETPTIAIWITNNISKTLTTKKTSSTKKQLAHHLVSLRTFITHKISNLNPPSCYQNKTQGLNTKLPINKISNISCIYPSHNESKSIFMKSIMKSNNKRLITMRRMKKCLKMITIFINKSVLLGMSHPLLNANLIGMKRFPSFPIISNSGSSLSTRRKKLREFKHRRTRRLIMKDNVVKVANIVQGSRK